MSARFFSRSVRLGIVAFIGLTIQGLVAPERADAGCDHPLPSISEKDRATLDLLDFVDFQTPLSKAPAAPATPGPCRGAFCSGEPATPPVPISIPNMRIDRWLGFERLILPPASGSALLTVEDDAERPIHQGLSLFRPPRRPA